MRGVSGRTGGSGGAFAALLALVLLFRLLIPAGYMIGPTETGGPGLVLCGAAAEPRPHESHGSSHEAPSGTVETPCPYAALTAPVLPPAPPAVLPPTAAGVPAAPRPIGNPISPALAAPPPPATGPPLPA